MSPEPVNGHREPQLVRKFTTILALTLPLFAVSACTGNDGTIDLGQPSGTLSEAPSFSVTGSGGALRDETTELETPARQFAAVDVTPEYIDHTFYTTSTGGVSGSELINAEVGDTYESGDGATYVITDVRSYAEREGFADDTAINIDAVGRLVLAGQDDGENQPYVAVIAQCVSE
jgi:hypothetical protein